jgi:ectoine hydroxylase-related dioxygenase (phytanoyl-CoA dioxygenase family)
MNEAVLTLITYLLGEACVLSSFGAVIEGPSEGESTPRTDNAMIPSPFPPYAQVAQATWVLSDESQENGAELVIPGSHRFYRHPPRSEALAPEIFVPVKAARGSVIVWHGNLWHRSIPRSAPCPRAELSVLFCRMYCRTQEQYRSNVPREILGRQSERFGRLMGEHIAYGWTEAGPDFSTEDRRKYLGLERDPGERLYD